MFLYLFLFYFVNSNFTILNHCAQKTKVLRLAFKHNFYLCCHNRDYVTLKFIIMFIISVYFVRKDGSFGERLSQVCVDNDKLLGRITQLLRKVYPHCYILTDYVTKPHSNFIDVDLPF